MVAGEKRLTSYSAAKCGVPRRADRGWSLPFICAATDSPGECPCESTQCLNEGIIMDSFFLRWLFCERQSPVSPVHTALRVFREDENYFPSSPSKEGTAVQDFRKCELFYDSAYLPCPPMGMTHPRHGAQLLPGKSPPQTTAAGSPITRFPPTAAFNRDRRGDASRRVDRRSAGRHQSSRTVNTKAGRERRLQERTRRKSQSPRRSAGLVPARALETDR